MAQSTESLKNQPSYTTFNKSFEQVHDDLYLLLNEVDSDVLKEEIEEPSKIFTTFDGGSWDDPRTKTRVDVSTYDYSSKKLGYKFPNPQTNYSSLSCEEQAACLRVLLARQRNVAETSKDSLIWTKTQEKRCLEYQQAQKHVHGHASAHKELLYASIKEMIVPYKLWYQKSIQHLERVQNNNYITHHGLPLVQKIITNQIAKMNNVQVVKRVGQVRLWPEADVDQQALNVLRVHLGRYACAEPLCDIVFDCAEFVEEEPEDDVFIIPLDSMLMLLTSGSYTDLPAEMFLTISAKNKYKCIEFKEPIPSRNVGWHTNSALVTRAYQAYASQPAQAHWLQFVDSKGTTPVKETIHIIDDNANDLNLQTEYKLREIKEYCSEVNNLRSNRALVRWYLSPEEKGSKSFRIYSPLQIPAVRDLNGQHNLGCHFIKLENKPDCGCEIMTTYELFSAWLQLSLLQSSLGYCTRVSLPDFAILLKERLTLLTLEEQLHEYYNISMPKMLSKLHEFLKILLPVAPDEYLLRYTPIYNEKFLLCMATNLDSQLVFNLRNQVTNWPSGYSFLTQTDNYLPISHKLCSRLHEELQLLPCSFPVRPKGVRARKQRVVQVSPKKIVQRKVLPSKKKRKRRVRKNAKKLTVCKAKAQEEKKTHDIMVL